MRFIAVLPVLAALLLPIGQLSAADIADIINYDWNTYRATSTLPGSSATVRIVSNKSDVLPTVWGEEYLFADPVSTETIYWSSAAPLMALEGRSGEHVIAITFSEPVPLKRVALAVRGMANGYVQVVDVDANSNVVGDFRLLNNPNGGGAPGYSYASDGTLSLTDPAGTVHGTALLRGDPIDDEVTVRSLGLRFINTQVGDRFDLGVGFATAVAVDVVIDNPQPDPNDYFGAPLLLNRDRLLAVAPGEDLAGEDAGYMYLFDAATGDELQSFTPYPHTGDPKQQANFRDIDLLRDSALAINALSQFEVPVYDVGSGEVTHVLQAPVGGALGLLPDGVRPDPMDADGRRVAVAGLAAMPVDGSACDRDTRPVVYIFDVPTGDVRQQIENPGSSGVCINGKFRGNSNSFGTGVQLSGKHLLVTAPDYAGADGPGAVYVFNSYTGKLRYRLTPDSPQGPFAEETRIISFGNVTRVSGDYAWVTSIEELYQFQGATRFPVYAVYIVDLTTGVSRRLPYLQDFRIDDRLVVTFSLGTFSFLHAMSGELLGEMPGPRPGFSLADASYDIEGFRLALGNEGAEVSGPLAERVYVYDLDADDDAIADVWEVRYGLDPANADDALEDADSDNLNNLDEYRQGTDPGKADTDGDTLSDGAEVNEYASNPLLADGDGDGLDDIVEINEVGTNPLDKDTDNDRMTDGWEYANGLDPLVADGESDPDSDGMISRKEQKFGTDPLDRDTDDDGLADGGEVFKHGTDPLLPDTDGDNLKDGQEVRKYGTDPTSRDTDSDDLRDRRELFGTKTDPVAADTDGDFMTDGWEVENGLDPLVDDAKLDPDNDTLSNRREFQKNSDPLDADSDGDRLPDGWEVQNRLPVNTPNASKNPDRDGYTNLEEYQNGTDPKVFNP